MDSRLLQQLVKSIQDTVKCPVCGNFYPEPNIRFKGNMNNFYLFNLTCANCQSNVFAQVLANSQGAKSQADIFVEPNRATQIMPDIKKSRSPSDRGSSTQEESGEAKKSIIKADEVIAFAKFIDRNSRPFSTWIS